MWHFILAQMFLVAACVWSLAASAGQLQDVRVAEAPGRLTAVYTFDKPISAEGVGIEYLNQTVQLNFPHSRLGQPRTDWVRGERFRSVYTYQASADVLRSRLIQQGRLAARDLEGFVEVTAKENQIQVVVHDPAKRASTIQRPPNDLNAVIEGSAGAGISPASSQDILKAELDASIDTEAQALITQSEASSTAPVDEKTTPLQQSPPKNPEASIPLFKQGEARKSETGQALNSLVLSLALILGSAMLLIGGARWYRGRTRTAQVQTRIQMLTQFHLGPKKSLALVQVAGETLLVGVTDHNITLIKALSLLDDEIPERIPKSFTDEVVREVESEIDRKVEARSRPVLSAATAGAEADDLVHNVKDMVTTRLRNMRSI